MKVQIKNLQPQHRCRQNDRLQIEIGEEWVKMTNDYTIQITNNIGYNF